MTNRKRKEPVVRVTVGLDSSDHDQLSRLAAVAGVSLSWMLRRAASEFLAGQGDQQPTAVLKRPRIKKRDQGNG